MPRPAKTSPKPRSAPPAPAPGIEADWLLLIGLERVTELCEIAAVPLDTVRSGQLTSQQWRRLFIAALNTPAPGQAPTALPLLHIQWQDGSVKTRGKNGVQIEDVLAKAITRLEVLNGQVPSRENLSALDHLRASLRQLELRTANRIAQGVEGTGRAHHS